MNDNDIRLSLLDYSFSALAADRLGLFGAIILHHVTDSYSSCMEPLNFDGKLLIKADTSEIKRAHPFLSDEQVTEGVSSLISSGVILPVNISGVEYFEKATRGYFK